MKGKTKNRRVAWTLTCTAMFFYFLLNYGGIRSPDSELVFLTAESLAQRGSFALMNGLQLWSDFGVATGRDSRSYSVFGPGQSIFAAPLVKAAEVINRTGWYKKGTWIPISHYCGDGYHLILSGTRPGDVEPHAKRFLVSMLNPIVTALAVLVFFQILLEMTGSLPASGMVAALFAFGTPLVVYSGTFFSEPLATLFCLLSFLYLNRGATSTADVIGDSLWSGFFLGTATMCHITAILFAPFFIFILLVNPASSMEFSGTRIRKGVFFTVGLAIPVVMLIYYNYARFGIVSETGRGIGDSQQLGYGEFTAPWSGLSGLLWSAGKGLFWFSPLCLLGIALWGRLTKANRLIGWTILAALIFRLMFIASRTDWHGGFSLGPRYMVMAAPFFLLPIAFWASKNLISFRKRTITTLAVILICSAALQLFLSVGEVFTFYHIIKENAVRQGVNIFTGEIIYRATALSPILFLLRGLRGPWIFQQVGLSNYSVWGVLTGIFATLALFWSLWMGSLNEKYEERKQEDEKMHRKP